jgi:soluble lytic murein transglycosylase-like protein
MMADPRSWEIDPLLRRAKVLTDLGLDDLARMEIERVEAVHPEASHREAMALRALMQIRSGERRAGIVRLRQAFPELGGPAQGSIPTEILRAYYPLEYEQVIRQEARSAGLPAHLVAGIIRQESAFDPRAKSRAGARGLMQVMPRTGRELALRMGLPWSTSRLVDPEFNLRLGTTYLRQVLEMFGGNLDLALAGYNGGPFRVKRLWAEAGADRELDRFLEGLAIEESKTYVKRILVLADSYRQLYPEGRRDGESEL